ncbi:MAG: Type III restriction protein res subunit [Syntrophaceae bacterium]|nr:MAG: Type III restriction protein res subunit [Syntrophaceae bacterium]
MPPTGIFDNEASAVDLKAYDELKDLHWKLGDTLLYQPKYDLTPEQQEEYPGSKFIKPDFVLQDIQGVPLAVIENKLEYPTKALPKLRLKYSRILKPRFLYACAKGEGEGLKILHYDMSWRGIEAGEFRAVGNFLSLEEMKLKIAQEQQKTREQDIVIDTNIAGGYDPTAGKARYYQFDCIQTLLDAYRNGKMKMLVHMATGLGKTRVIVALVKALLQYGLAKRVLFVVDRRFLARQAIQKGFSLISPTYNSSWITSSNLRAHKNKDVHVVVIDTLELLYSRIPENYYDLLIVDECHRSITMNRKLIFDHFLCPRIGLTATPRIAKLKEGAEIPEEDLAIMDTYRLFGCETKNPDYEFDLDRGIREEFLAPYSKIEVITELTRQAMKDGIEYDHLLDPDSRKRIELNETKKIELEKLNKKILSEEQAMRWAEEVRSRTEYGEKAIFFAASQAHALMLVKALNEVFNDKGDSPHYAEAVIAENDDLNYTIKEWFERPYQNPRIVVSVDIMTTGVDVPCVRYIVFAALTKSVGKYIQMIGRGTRLDPKSGKFSFTVLDFVGLCARMQDNGKGSPKENIKIVDGKNNRGGGGGGAGPGVITGLLDNPDPRNLIQRVFIKEGNIKIIDNIPINQARKLFEEGVKSTQDPLIALLRRKAWEDKDYEPTEEELAYIREWVNKPEIYLSEEQLQRIYDFPPGSIWDFFLAVLEVKKIPTVTERIEAGFETYISMYNFTPEQIEVLRKIKNVFAVNISSHGKLDLNAIFANPIYCRLIGQFDEINQRFEGRLQDIVDEMEKSFRFAA